MKVFRSTLVIFIMVMLASCASMQKVQSGDWRATAYLAYASTGDVLEAVRTTAKSAGDAGMITPAKLAEIGALYTKARTSYRTAGDTLILASDIQDDVSRGELLKQVGTLLDEAKAVALQIEGIVKGGK